MKDKIDLYIVSGFLGSGKTTFLKNMLFNFDKKKTGVLVNEFGAVNIDSVRLSGDTIKMVEINNGSIFCSCLKGDFIKALIAFSNEDIEYLFIENSGLADPSNMRQILKEISEKTNKTYEYKGAICVVDATSFLKHVAVLPPVQNQVAHSSFIVLSKTDRVNKEQITDVTNKLKEINPHAYVYETIYAEVPLSVLDEKLTVTTHEGETSNKPWNRISTYALETEEDVSIEELTRFVEEIKDFAYRIKGYVKDKKKWISVDVTELDVRINETSLTRRDILKHTRLVVISKSTECILDKIKETTKNTMPTKSIEIYEG
ncbi:MAG TPA: GTP-binding protein [Clostridia bacterium]|jgi:G3E family GTPase|nr:GTP-binding protein [Clostridia bacterium]HPZ52209.1 GTP-binding protein [Clostridia bacterium]